jgi:hypothetical protein
MGNYIKVVKPGKSQMIEADKVDFYRQFGWEPAVVEITAKLKPPKKTVQPEPTVDEEVGTDIQVQGE